MKTGLQGKFDVVKGLCSEMWHRRWVGMFVAWPIAILCATGVTLMSNRYQADAKVYVDTQTVLKPLMTGLAVQPDMDQQIRMLARTLVSRPNVERLMDTPEIGFPKPVNREAEITLLMTKIKVEATGAGNLYAISYRDVDPQRAKRLVESLVQLFMTSSSTGQKHEAEEAAKFINAQIAEHETKLATAENRLKEFKLKNFGFTGVSNQDYFARMSVLAEQVAKLETDLRAAENSRDAFQRQLSSEAPQLPVEPGIASTAPRSEIEIRLEAQKSQLDELMRRFTDEHPDVVSVKRNIAMLEQQLRQQKEAQARANAMRGQGAAATSPVYQRIRMSLAQTEADIASLRSRLATERARLTETRALAGRVPEVEAELAQLNRDYDIIRKNYDSLVTRRESASLGERLDASEQLADFRLVEPPRVSPTPVAPSRLVLALATLIVTAAAGLGAAYAATRMRPTFRDTRTLAEFCGRQVLGSVPLLMRPALRVQQRADVIKFSVFVALLLSLQMGWLIWIFLTSRT